MLLYCCFPFSPMCVADPFPSSYVDDFCYWMSQTSSYSFAFEVVVVLIFNQFPTLGTANGLECM